MKPLSNPSCLRPPTRVHSAPNPYLRLTPSYMEQSPLIYTSLLLRHQTEVDDNE